MLELIKKEDKVFKEYYEREVFRKKVVCILDDYYVCYMVNRNNKITRHEFSNDKKSLCFKNATRALNR